MRVQLKHILPVALLLTGVVAKTTESDESTAVEKASATDDSATETAKETATGKDEESTATETGSDSTATESSDDKDSSETGKKTTAKSTKTTSVKVTDTWVATVPSTMAPDLEATGSASLNSPNYIIVTLSVGLLTAGMTFL